MHFKVKRSRILCLIIITGRGGGVTQIHAVKSEPKMYEVRVYYERNFLGGKSYGQIYEGKGH